MPPSLADSYRQMLTIRLVEEKLMEALALGLISGSTHLCIGQEAIPVGACAALRSDDPLIATYRGHGWALARGVPPAELMAEIMGRDSALNGGRAGSAYLSAPEYHFYGENSIVGAGVPIALGLAIACQRSGEGRVPVVSIGDGAMNQGNVHESLNMASVLGIPLIIVVENNGYAEMTPSALLTAVPAAARAAAYAIPAIETDGNDPDAVFDAVSAARSQAVSASKPVLIEAHTHRLAGHYSGDAQAYRPVGEVEARRASDPLTRTESRLSSADFAEVQDRVQREVVSAFAQAQAMQVPDAEQVADHVYSH